MDHNEKLDLSIRKLEKFDKMDERLDKMDNRFDRLDLDVSRKLDEALKVENEREMIAIRVNILKNELWRIKEQLDIA